MTKRERATIKFSKVFTPRAQAALRAMGATVQDGSVENFGSARFSLVTKAGILNVTVYDTWIAARFDDVDAAKALGLVGLNPYSGKYNFHFVAEHENPIACVDYWTNTIKQILPN